jgi:hypothetical protein
VMHGLKALQIPIWLLWTTILGFPSFIIAIGRDSPRRTAYTGRK